MLRTSQEVSIDKVRQLMHLKGIGINGAWLLVMEFFGWRELKKCEESMSKFLITCSNTSKLL